MTQRPSRARRPAAPAQSRTDRTPEVNAAVETWQRPLDLTRAMLGASLDTSRELMQGLCEWQAAQTALLQHTTERIGHAAALAEHATDWPSLMKLQASLASEQWTQAVEDAGALAERAMQIESRFIERSRADAMRISEHWAGNGWKPVAVAAQSTEVDAPLALLSQAQAAMSQFSRLWTQALYNTALPD